MSREIKFRVWDKDLAKYLGGCEIDSLMAELSAEDDGRAMIIEQICPARYIFEQYTGLIDKNGKEIYEGDIVNVDGQRCVMRAFVRPALIESGFALFDSQIRQRELQERSADTAEVIGNIHENPELLGGEE